MDLMRARAVCMEALTNMAYSEEDGEGHSGLAHPDPRPGAPHAMG